MSYNTQRLQGLRDIARNIIPGQKGVAKFGYNKDVDTGASGETVRASGGLFTPITEAQTLDIVSDSIADDFGSTGMQYLRIDGLDENYLEIQEDVFMDGTNTVTTTNSFVAVNRCVGILFGSGRENAGTVTVTQTTSGTEMAVILPGVGITQQLIYTVPANHEAQLVYLKLDALKTSGGSSPRVQFIYHSYVLESNGSYKTIDQTIDTGTNSEFVLETPFANEIAHKTTIWIDAITDTNNTEVSGRFYLVLYPRIV
jgi:hypothetical protein